MATVTMERLDEIATAWRRGLDADDLTNPAGPIFTEGAYTEYDITATGGGKETHYYPTNGTWASAMPCNPNPVCICCII